ncbi:uncharacterized protein [Chelonus insularis]|uniref:uncharacterized protein n=1 Tax=Chelonus insularis TaxID=460826 RepID=UPI00158E6438|nr:uncharacterized protein LOC118073033 [Chelonus insularis]
MRQLRKSIASIAILGAVLAMALSEMEDEKHSAVGDAGHRKEISNESSLESTSQRCGKQDGIESEQHENNHTREIKTDQLKMFENHECKNRTQPLSTLKKKNDSLSRIKSDGSSMIPSQEFMENDRIRDNQSLKVEDVAENHTNFLTTIDSYKLLVDEAAKIAADVSHLEGREASNETIEDEVDVRHEKKQDLSMFPRRLENQLVDLDRIRKPTSSSELITQVRSAKHITFSTTSEFARNSSFARGSNDTTGLEDETLESPLVVSPPQILPSGTRFSTKEKSPDGFMIESKLPYLKKDYSKPSINLVDGKASKVFYEIKPSLNTAMQDRDDDVDIEKANGPMIVTTRRSFLSAFKIPSLPSSFGKFGPYFLDDADDHNITERIGSTVMLNCRIGLLGDKKVTWLQHVKDSIRLLTVGNVQYSADERISLKFQYPDNWRLQIAYATLRDSGLYKCQVEIDPTHSLVKKYNVVITAPILNITDDSGRVISGERHLKAGSALKLRCEGRDILESLNESLLWTKGDETLTSNVSENRTTKIVADKEIPVIVSTLIVERATPRHAGNYSCTVPERAKTTIAVHVLNGELPAAVHHGNGVSRAVLNFWLIHLTVSSGFFR